MMSVVMAVSAPLQCILVLQATKALSPGKLEVTVMSYNEGFTVM